MVTLANETDRDGAIEMFNYFCVNSNNLSQVKKVLVDGGYTGENFANEIKKISSAEVEVVKRNELHNFAVLPYPPTNPPAPKKEPDLTRLQANTNNSNQLQIQVTPNNLYPRISP